MDQISAFEWMLNVDDLAERLLLLPIWNRSHCVKVLLNVFNINFGYDVRAATR